MPMTESIKLDGYASLGGVEVKNVWPSWLLTTEFVSGEAPGTQESPQAAFSPGGVSSQLPGTTARGHAGSRYAEVGKFQGAILERNPHPGLLPSDVRRRMCKRVDPGSHVADILGTLDQRVAHIPSPVGRERAG